MARNGNRAVPLTPGSFNGSFDESFAQQFQAPPMMDVSLVQYFSKNTEQYRERWKTVVLMNERLEHQLHGLQDCVNCIGNDLRAERQHSMESIEEERRRFEIPLRELQEQWKREASV